MDLHPPYNSRPRGVIGQRRGGRGSGYGYRGRSDRRRSDQGRNEHSRHRFIETSSDGESLVYSELGTDNFGGPSMCEPVFKSLKLIGEYSEDSEKKFRNDRSYLSFILTKYLPDSSFMKQKVLDLDLANHEVDGFSDDGQQVFSNFLTWIVNNKETFSQEMKFQDTSCEGGTFVTIKNVLSNFLTIPYRYSADLKFYAACIGGLIYIRREYKPVYSIVGKWPKKFKHFMTKENTTEKVSCNDNFRTVLSCNLGPHKLLYSFATDCANPEEFNQKFTDLSSFVTLACCKEPDPHSNRFRDNMLYWYLDYILLGVPKLLLGFRNYNGVVKRLRLYEPPEMLIMGKELWNPSNCLVFTSKLLSFIKSRVESDPGAVFCIEKNQREAVVTCSKVKEFEDFLPDWFIQEIHYENKNHTQ